MLSCHQSHRLSYACVMSKGKDQWLASSNGESTATGDLICPRLIEKDEVSTPHGSVPYLVRLFLALLSILLLTIGLVRTIRLYDSDDLPVDFSQYWAVGRLILQAENPYDPALQLREQRRIYPDRDTALMMWNPPPALALYVPWGLLPAREAALLWNASQLVAVLGAVALLVRVYAPNASFWLFLPLTLGYVGTWWLLFYGQNTGWIVLGLAGFAWGQQQRRPWLAGCCGALTVIKPHLLLSFGLVWLGDFAVRGMQRRALVAGVLTVASATLLVHLSDPMVVQHFLVTLWQPSQYAVPLSQWKLPTASYWLREWLLPTSFWVQFVPAGVISISLLAGRLRQGGSWDWPRQLPMIVALSVLVTGYGGWIFDLPVLLVPLIAAASMMLKSGRTTWFLYLTVWQLFVTFATLQMGGSLHAFWWVAPAVLGPCLLVPFVLRR